MPREAVARGARKLSAVRLGERAGDADRRRSLASAGARPAVPVGVPSRASRNGCEPHAYWTLPVTLSKRTRGTRHGSAFNGVSASASTSTPASSFASTAPRPVPARHLSRRARCGGCSKTASACTSYPTSRSACSSAAAWIPPRSRRWRAGRARACGATRSLPRARVRRVRCRAADGAAPRRRACRSCWSIRARCSTAWMPRSARSISRRSTASTPIASRRRCGARARRWRCRAWAATSCSADTARSAGCRRSAVFPPSRAGRRASCGTPARMPSRQPAPGRIAPIRPIAWRRCGASLTRCRIRSSSRAPCSAREMSIALQRRDVGARRVTTDVADTDGWRRWNDDTVRMANGLDAFGAVSCFELRSYMLNTLLRDADAMSMAHSLELRVPLLDHPIVEFVAAQAAAVKERHGAYKPLLVDALGDLLPREVSERPKRGFTFPWAQWMRGPLAPRVTRGCAISRPRSMPTSIGDAVAVGVDGVSSRPQRLAAAVEPVRPRRLGSPSPLIARHPDRPRDAPLNHHASRRLHRGISRAHQHVLRARSVRAEARRRGDRHLPDLSAARRTLVRRAGVSERGRAAASSRASHQSAGGAAAAACAVGASAGGSSPRRRACGRRRCGSVRSRS